MLKTNKTFFERSKMMISTVGIMTLALIGQNCTETLLRNESARQITVKEVQQKIFIYGGLIALSDSCNLGDIEEKGDRLIFNSDSTFYYYSNNMNGLKCSLGRFNVNENQIELIFGSIVTEKKIEHFNDVPFPNHKFNTILCPEFKITLSLSWCGEKIKMMEGDVVMGIQVSNLYADEITMLMEEGLKK